MNGHTLVVVGFVFVVVPLGAHLSVKVNRGATGMFLGRSSRWAPDQIIGLTTP